ncbi:MAG TPA: 2-amino-4-hydroxy-6-hydroxymethyldihydropteridine diphosphokinase [Caulobacteraceae bacterium]|jgi:2-amino-4-hydroxy-6-hydroxymethyldihydropteridine diphosphokinase
MGEHAMTEWDEAVVVALGSNVRGSYASLENLLEAALEAFAAEGLNVTSRSSWWRSAAWPDPAGPEYRNGVAIVETTLDPAAVLQALHRIEGRFGRERGERNAPRTLDLDLVAYGRLVRDTDPTLPHPRAAERRFVMGPLTEIAPAWLHPVTHKTASELAARASVGSDASPAGARDS